jgi:hypothetical protein
MNVGFGLGGLIGEPAVDLGHEFKGQRWAPSGLGITREPLNKTL